MLLFKLIIVPMLIWLISNAGRKWGPLVAGSLSAFPVIVGPALLFMTMEQGRAFGANAAVGSIAAVLALIAFSVTYAWVAVRSAWWLCLTLALTVYTMVVVILQATDWTLASASVFVVMTLLIVNRLLPKWQEVVPTKTKFTYDVPLRMLIGGSLVFSLTLVANAIGSKLSGIFSMFPVTGSVLLVFSHIYHGREFSINLVHGMLIGWWSISVFCITLSWALPQYSIFASFAEALGAAVATQIIGYTMRQHIK